MTLSKSSQTFLSWLTALLVLITLVLLAVRLLLFPAFPAIEYRLPGFPADQYVEFHDALPRALKGLRTVVGSGIWLSGNRSFTGGDRNSTLRNGPRAPSRR